MNDSAIMCDKIMETIKLLKYKILCFTCLLSITIALLIAVSIYCYLVKYRVKQKHLLPFHDTNNQVKQVVY